MYLDFKENPESYSIYKVTENFQNEACLFHNTLVDGNHYQLLKEIYEPIFESNEKVCFLLPENFWIMFWLTSKCEPNDKYLYSLSGRGSNLKKNHSRGFCYNFFGILAFIENSKVKTKTIKSRPKSKSFHCLHERQNDTGLDIHQCDLNWYTKSLQNHPFVVRGHWRMQACGQGMKDRKLKWIDTFMKGGYIKGAYKEKV
tara:strand:- start:7 stop:606 length:600 start_codon:yes stop_codon:yes gene_type:complete